MLPAATGGDWGRVNVNGDIRFPYDYEVTGLPPGLDFDAATRTLSGTPTRAGTFTVTYTAGDADNVQDESDEASQTFRVRVPGGPQITQVRIVSHPTYDSAGKDGVPDTYVRNDEILVDVEFNEPVAVSGDNKVRLRLDLGTDDADPGNSRRVTTDADYSVLYGGRTLRFAYKVVASDNDTDGVWVQTGTLSGVAHTVLFTPGTTIAHAVTGAAADLTADWLPTTGNPRAKVDGSKTSADIGPKPTGATVNGATLTVTFDENLDTSVDTDELRYRLHVHGAGGLGADDRNDKQSPSAVSVSGSTLTLKLGVPAQAGDTVTVTYEGTTLKGDGASGKQAPMFPRPGGDQQHVRHGGARAAERVGGGEEAEDGLQRRPGRHVGAGRERLHGRGGRPGRRQPEIAGTGTADINDAVVTVTLAEAMRADEQGTVSYEKPSSSPLRARAPATPRCGRSTASGSQR